MDKINKALLKLPDKQRKKLMKVFGLVLVGQTTGLNIKKLKGHSNLYRLKVGSSRLIFQQTKDGEPIVVHIGNRDDQTYRDF